MDFLFGKRPKPAEAQKEAENMLDIASIVEEAKNGLLYKTYTIRCTNGTIVTGNALNSIDDVFDAKRHPENYQLERIDVGMVHNAGWVVRKKV